MELPQSPFFTRVVKDFEAAYTFFKLEYRLLDTPTSKVAFYAACEKMVADNPLPDDPAMQAAILKHIREVKDEALEEYVERVELLFQDMIQARVSL